MEQGHIEYAVYLDNIENLTEEIVADIEKATTDFYVVIGGKRHSIYKLWFTLQQTHNVKLGKSYLFVVENNLANYYELADVIKLLGVEPKADTKAKSVEAKDKFWTARAERKDASLDTVDKFWATHDQRKGVKERVRKNRMERNEKDVTDTMLKFSYWLGALTFFAVAIGAFATNGFLEGLVLSIFWTLLCIFGFWVYFYPTYNAFCKLHPNRWGILIVNIIWFFGINWLVALVWTLSYDPNKVNRVDMGGF